jgi:hypothetical protein
VLAQPDGLYPDPLRLVGKQSTFQGHRRLPSVR